MPSRPRSPDEFTLRSGTACDSSAPFLMTRSAPPCCETNRRPSGAKAIAVGLASPVATRVSAKPVGNVAARADISMQQSGQQQDQYDRKTEARA